MIDRLRDIRNRKVFFCRRIEAIEDEAVAVLLDPMMRELAAQDRCPGFDGGLDGPDAYRAIDL